MKKKKESQQKADSEKKSLYEKKVDSPHVHQVAPALVDERDLLATEIAHAETNISNVRQTFLRGGDLQSLKLEEAGTKDSSVLIGRVSTSAHKSRVKDTKRFLSRVKRGSGGAGSRMFFMHL